MAIAVYIALTAILGAGTLLPFLPLAHGIARVGDFPRQQYLVLAALLLAASPLFADLSLAWLLVQALLALIALVQIVMIAEFTPLGRKQSARFDPASESGDRLRLVASNAKMSNERRDELRAEIEAADPDLVVLMEVDDAWAEALAPLLARYEDVISRPQENSYGMIVASRLPLSDISVQCLLTDGVPSVIATVATPGGRRFRLFSIHPEPPVPYHGAEGRDGETSLVALKVREETLPVIVTGDLNDVAWSRTTSRFRRLSGLLDPRIGRKIFSTFDARIPFLRWPLDHLFHSAEFRLVGMRRLKPCGSDHFPVQFDLVLCSEARAEGRPAPATEEDIARAVDLAKQAAERDEAPIGEDWEQT